MRYVQLIIPDHTESKLETLANHYAMSIESILQKVIVDRTDEIHEVVILEPEAKAKARKGAE